MGFVGGGGNIAIVSALPLSSLLIVVSIYSYHIGTLHLKFYSCLRLRFPDVETNPGPRRPVAASCRILCSNARDLSGNLSDLALASSQYDILLCSETLVSDLRHVSELLVPAWVRSPCLVVPGQAASCPWDGGICTRWIWSISPTKICVWLL